MKMTDAFPSKYVRAADLHGDVEATIESVELETLGQGSDQDTKPVVYFAGKKKGLVLNKTNGLQLAAAFGDETDGWAGKTITLFSMKVQGPSGVVDGIRLRIPSDQVRPVKAAAQAVPADPKLAESVDFDDDIPF